MNSIDMINRLKRLAVQSPELLREMKWEDINLCMSVELDYRRGVYHETQIKQLENYCISLVSEMKKSTMAGEYGTLRACLNELGAVMRTLPEIDYYEESVCRSNLEHEILRHYRERTIAVIGDSHVNFFSGNETLTFIHAGNSVNICPVINGWPLSVFHMGACLAYTCNQSGSSTGFHRKLEWLLSDYIRKDSPLMLSLGEIDLRAHVYKEAEKRKKTPEDVVEDILEQYAKMIYELIARGYSVIIWGPIATAQDAAFEKTDYPYYGTEQERNRATEYFNRRLERICNGAGAMYISIFKDMITEDYHTKNEYFSKDRFHLGQAAMKIAKPKLEQVFALRI